MSNIESRVAELLAKKLDTLISSMHEEIIDECPKTHLDPRAIR